MDRISYPPRCPRQHKLYLDLYRTLKSVQSDNSLQIPKIEVMMMPEKRSLLTVTLLLALILQLPGCGNSLQRKVTGAWKVDVGEDLFEMIGDEEGVSESRSRFMIEFASGGIFRSSVTASGYTQKKEGRWLFLEGAADICKLEVFINSNKSDIKPDNILTEVKFVDENTIELIPPNMDAIKHKMVFRRAR